MRRREGACRGGRERSTVAPDMRVLAGASSPVGPEAAARAGNRYPIGLARHDEAVAEVEAVRIAAAQRADAHRHAPRVGLAQHGVEHGRADPAALLPGQQVEVVEPPVVGRVMHRKQAGARAVRHDEPAGGRIERREEALARALRIEAADRFEAGAHRGDADGHQRVGVGGRRGGDQVHGGS